MKLKIFITLIIILTIFSTLIFPQTEEAITTRKSRSRYRNERTREELPIIRSSGRYSTGKIKSEIYGQQLGKQQLAEETVALEAPIEPDEYVVGPGDVLAINIWGEVNAGYGLEITPEGKLLIPTVRDIDLRGLTLTEAKKKIANTVMGKYLTRDVTVSLIHIRKFRVTVSGQVTNPGAIIVTAADRVSNAIRIANPPLEEEEPEVVKYSGKTTPLNIEVKKEPSKRHIILTRRNGEKFPIDLQGFEITGDKEKNPYLIEGDVIYVPLFTKNLPIVGVYGAVHEPDIYEFMEGDRVLDLIKLAHGFQYNADISNIEIARFNSDNQTTYSFNVDFSNVASGNGDIENNIPLQVDDRIYVRWYPEYRIRRQARIKGEIMYPGYYPIERGITRLSDVVKAAGGFTKNASLKEAYVIRRAYEDDVDPEYERLFEMRVEEMTDLEKEYYKIKSRERKGLVAVDFVGLFLNNDTTKDIVVQHDDYIEIPSKDEVVNVIGQVVRPGLVAFKKRQKLKYYIEKAGGYSWNAHGRKVRIIRAETGVWEKPKRNTIVNIGDTILVPEKPEKNYWTSFKDVLSATVQLVSLYVLIERITEK